MRYTERERDTERDRDRHREPDRRRQRETGVREGDLISCILYKN